MPLFILAIAPNGPAATLISIGDEILEINDCATTGLTHPEAVRLISSSGPAVKLKLRRNLTAGGMNDLFSPNGSIGGRVATPTQMVPGPPGLMHSPGSAPVAAMLSPSPTRNGQQHQQQQLIYGQILDPSALQAMANQQIRGSPNMMAGEYMPNQMNY